MKWGTGRNPSSSDSSGSELNTRLTEEGDEIGMPPSQAPIGSSKGSSLAEDIGRPAGEGVSSLKPELAA